VQCTVALPRLFTALQTAVGPQRCIFYGVSLAGIGCRRRWPPPTTLAMTTLMGQQPNVNSAGASNWEAVGRKFSHRHDNPVIVGVVRWLSASDTAGYRSTQPCIPPGSLNRIPASAGVKAGMSPLSGGRQHCEILYGM